MTDYYGKYDKKQIVQLFVDNMIWGNISINSFASQIDEVYHFKRSLEKNMIDFQKNPTEQTIDSIYEAIIKLRVNGAVSYMLRDKSAEEKIHELETELITRNEQISNLKSENTNLAEAYLPSDCKTTA